MDDGVWQGGAACSTLCRQLPPDKTVINYHNSLILSEERGIIDDFGRAADES